LWLLFVSACIYIFLLFTTLLGLDHMGFLPDTNKD